MPAAADKPDADRPRVVIARDGKCLAEDGSVDPAAAARLLASAMARLSGAETPKAAWAGLFKPADRVAIKVNCLGHSTDPAVARTVSEALIDAGLAAENVLIWDRSSAELTAAGFTIVNEGKRPRCFGTDALRGRGVTAGYESNVITSGEIGSRFSTIVSRWATALINLPVLKDHSLSGLSGGMKNFFGAIHNPNKYHDNHCDPFVADVSNHPWISRKLRLVVVDAAVAQYHGGPGRVPRCRWPLGGLVVGTDPVAVDAVCADLLDAQRRSKGLKTLADDGRPPQHIASAAARNLGVADLAKIDRVEIGP